MPEGQALLDKNAHQQASPTRRLDCDIAIVGAGIVGLATALAIVRHRPDARIVVFDKEEAPARHQTGRNSGVVHSGIYYPPGSLKAELVRSGRALLAEFCREHEVPIDFPGKVVTAVADAELGRLEQLADRGTAHGLAIRRLDPAGIRAIEPHAAGIAGLYVPETGRTDFRAVAVAMATELERGGVEIRLGRVVRDLVEERDSVRVVSDAGDLLAGRVVVCAGLGRQALTRGGSGRHDLMVVPFRGEYFELVGAATDLVRSMIYPVPDPRLPFLGVHLTRGIDGTVHAGPNAVPAFAAEGYRRRDVELRHLADLARFPGSRRLARSYWRSGLEEIHRSMSRTAFVRALQRLLPEVDAAMLRPAPAGVRAQALRRDGTLLDDFAFRHTGRIVYVDNAPSPAATASLAIGRHIAHQVV